jgi:hypothetical protein
MSPLLLQTTLPGLSTTYVPEKTAKENRDKMFVR